MRKIIRNILPALALALILIMPGDKTMAGTIASIDAGVKDGTVTVSGTADSGVLSVAIFVYDEAGENMLQMKSVAVASDQKYSEDFKLSDGKYLVKAADYDGGKFAETTVTVGESKEEIRTIRIRAVKIQIIRTRIIQNRETQSQAIQS